jgi:hypothetical protein
VKVADLPEEIWRQYVTQNGFQAVLAALDTKNSQQSQLEMDFEGRIFKNK